LWKSRIGRIPLAGQIAGPDQRHGDHPTLPSVMKRQRSDALVQLASLRHLCSHGNMVENGCELSRTQILTDVQTIVRKQVMNDQINLSGSTVVDDIPEWDSTAHVQIVVAIEAYFDIRFEPEEYLEFANVGEMVDCVISKLAARDGLETANSTLGGG
jgi:acyl carrier protein